jgi:hypothetical protein
MRCSLWCKAGRLVAHGWVWGRGAAAAAESMSCAAAFYVAVQAQETSRTGPEKVDEVRLSSTVTYGILVGIAVQTRFSAAALRRSRRISDLDALTARLLAENSTHVAAWSASARHCCQPGRRFVNLTSGSSASLLPHQLCCCCHAADACLCCRYGQLC